MVDEADSPSSTNSTRWREKEPEGSQPPRHVRCRMNRGEVRKDLIGETAAVVAAQRGAGMALGHAALSYARTGERAPINAEMYDTFTQLVSRDAPGFVRHAVAQVTKGGVGEDLAKRIMERVPGGFGLDGWRAVTADEPFGEALQELDCPLLLAKHEGCLMSTDAGFEDVVAALPHAKTAVFEDAPSASPAFAEELRRFSSSIGTSSTRACTSSAKQAPIQMETAGLEPASSVAKQTASTGLAGALVSPCGSAPAG